MPNQPMRRFADQRPVQQAVVVGVLWPAFSESPANPSQRVCMDYALRRSLSKDAQNRVFHAHWGLSGSDDEAALRRPAPIPSPVIAKIDLDETLVTGTALYDLKRRKEKEAVKDRTKHITVLESLRKFLNGSSSIDEPQMLKTYITNHLAQQHGPECAAEFEHEVAVWTHAVEVTLPGPDNSTTHVVVTIPMLSVKAGTMVYAKLPLELDQAFIKAAKVKNSTVQDNCVENWRNHIEKTYQDDSSFRYVVMKFPDNASDLIDALFRVKVASEMAVGRSAKEAAVACGEVLRNTLLRVATRNMQISYITAALAALDPEGRALSINEVLLFQRDAKAQAIGKPTLYMAGNVFNHRRKLLFRNSVVVGIDNTKLEMLLPLADDHASGLALESYVCHVKEVTLAGAEGSVDQILFTLERAARAAGLGDLDLFASYDSRSLQQRQLSGLSSSDSRQLGVTGLRRSWEAAAAAATSGYQGSPAAPLAAALPAASSPMAVDGSAEAATHTPARASQAADGSCKPFSKADDRELTPGDKKSPTVAAVLKKPRTAATAAAGTTQQQRQAAAVAGSSSGNELMAAAGGTNSDTQQVAEEGSRSQVSAAGDGNSSVWAPMAAASGNNSGRPPVKAAGDGSSSGWVPMAAASINSSDRQPLAAAGSSSGLQQTITTLPSSSSSSGGGRGGAAANLGHQFAEAAAVSTSPAAAPAWTDPHGNLLAWEHGVLNTIRIKSKAADDYANDTLLLTQQGLILVSPPEEHKPSANEYARTQYVAIGPDAVQQMREKSEGVLPHRIGHALQKLKPVKSTIDCRNFIEKFSAAKRQGQCLLVEARKVFTVSTLTNGTRRQCDRNSHLLKKSADRWQPEDPDGRQVALDARVWAIVRSMLAGHPQLPPGLELFAVEQENPTADNSSTSIRGQVSAAAEQMARV